MTEQCCNWKMTEHCINEGCLGTVAIKKWQSTVAKWLTRPQNDWAKWLSSTIPKWLSSLYQNGWVHYCKMFDIVAECHTSVLKEVNWSFHTCVQDVQITRTSNSNGKTAQMLWLQHIQSMSTTKWPLCLKKYYKPCSNTSFILSATWAASTGADRGRGLPSFLPLARTAF
jgi:hypothetical protein